MDILARRLMIAGPINIDTLLDVDRFGADDDTVVCRSLTRSLGGNAANAAVHASMLGTRTALKGVVGDDGDGAYALRALRDAGVDIQRVSLSRSAPTGTAVSAVRRSDGVRSLYIHEGANAHWVDASELDVGGFALVIAYGLPQRAYEELARDHSGKIIFNPGTPILNGRFDEVAWFSGHCHTLVLNEVEAKAVSGASSLEAAAAEIRRVTQAERLIITHGAKGAYFFSEEADFHRPAFETNVRDTTGAGDGFLAGYSVATLNGEDTIVAVTWGCATAALSISEVGASAGAPAASAVQKLVNSAVG